MTGDNIYLNNKINVLLNQYTPVVPPISYVNNINDSNNIVRCKVDSGSTNAYIREQDEDILYNIIPDTNNRVVTMPNSHNAKIKEIGILNTECDLSLKGKTASIVPSLTSASL